MKRLARSVLPALVLLGGIGMPVGARAQAEERRVNQALDLGGLLAGTWEGSTPGNSLHVVMTNVVSPAPGSVFNVAVTVTGKYQDTAVRQQGVMRLENQGRVVYLTYLPHFDPTVGGLSTDVLRFAPNELESACSFDVAPRGDGFAGTTTGATTCARAIRGAVGKWSFEVEPGSLRIRNVDTGETMRFKKTTR